MKKTSCPECKMEQLALKRGDYETQYVDRDEKTQRLTVLGLSWLECTNCGEVILEDEAMAMVEAARRKALGLLSPQEVRDLRLGLGRTQAAMSDLLGIGEKTYCRWESGAYVQSEAFDRYLRLVMSDAGNVQLLEEITAAKTKPGSEESSAPKERDIFRFIKDIGAAVERGRVFTEMMSQGPLYAA
jgi:putative zinc finger/helix-turn-helix YgiT family protein